MPGPRGDSRRREARKRLRRQPQELGCLWRPCHGTRPNTLGFPKSSSFLICIPNHGMVKPLPQIVSLSTTCLLPKPPRHNVFSIFYVKSHFLFFLNAHPPKPPPPPTPTPQLPPFPDTPKYPRSHDFRSMGGVLHAVHKVCTGPYLNCIVVPIVSIIMGLVVHLYDLPACLALISSAFVCVVVHVTQTRNLILCYSYAVHSSTLVRGPPLLCHLSDLHIHINGKGVPGVVTASLSQSARP